MRHNGRTQAALFLLPCLLACGGCKEVDDFIADHVRLDVRPTVEFIDVDAGTLETRSTPPLIVGSVRPVVLPGARVALLGGYEGLRYQGRIAIYDVVDDSWTLGPPLPHPRIPLQAPLLVGDRLCVGPGLEPLEAKFTNLLECYDLLAGGWQAFSATPDRDAHLLVMAGELYAIDGHSDQLVAYRWDPLGDVWSTVGSPLAGTAGTVKSVVQGTTATLFNGVSAGSYASVQFTPGAAEPWGELRGQAHEVEDLFVVAGQIYASGKEATYAVDAAGLFEPFADFSVWVYSGRPAVIGDAFFSYLHNSGGLDLQRWDPATATAATVLTRPELAGYNFTTSVVAVEGELFFVGDEIADGVIIE